MEKSIPDDSIRTRLLDHLSTSWRYGKLGVITDAAKDFQRDVKYNAYLNSSILNGYISDVYQKVCRCATLNFITAVLNFKF